MKCLSLWQPWAHLIAIGVKPYETRDWGTSYRGPLAIAAAKKWNRELEAICFTPHFLKAMRPNCADADNAMLATLRGSMGCVVATCTLKDCRQVQSWAGRDGSGFSLRFFGGGEICITDAEFAFGDYSPGRWVWFLADAKAVPPVAIVGRQGLFNVPDALLQEAA